MVDAPGLRAAANGRKKSTAIALVVFVCDAINNVSGQTGRKRGGVGLHAARPKLTAAFK